MTQEEFNDNVDELFDGYIVQYLEDETNLGRVIYFYLNNRLLIGIDDYQHLIFDDISKSSLYLSDDFDDLEQHFDDIIIFKELILPKYL